MHFTVCYDSQKGTVVHFGSKEGTWVGILAPKNTLLCEFWHLVPHKTTEEWIWLPRWYWYEYFGSKIGACMCSLAPESTLVCIGYYETIAVCFLFKSGCFGGHLSSHKPNLVWILAPKRALYRSFCSRVSTYVCFGSCECNSVNLGSRDST